MELIIYAGAVGVVTWLVVKSYKWKQRTGNPTPKPPKKTGNPTPKPPKKTGNPTPKPPKK